MAKAKPVVLTQAASAPNAGFDAQPLQIIGKLPSGSFTATTLTAVPASFADLAAVRTYLNTLVTELKSSPYFD